MEHESWSIAALQDVNGLADSIARSGVLNLPLLFAVALALTIFGPAAPSRTFMLLLYIFDLMLVLALTYPVLVFLVRKRVKRSG